MLRPSAPHRRMMGILLLLAGATAAWAGTRSEVMASLEPHAGRTVTRITLQGNRVTKDWVIDREIATAVGAPLDMAVIGADLVRLENLAIFGSVSVEPTATAGGVDLDFRFTEMPWIIPYPAISFTEENGFSLGLGVNSPNFLGRDISLSASAVFGGVTNYGFKGQDPWIAGNHVSAGVEVFHQTRRNELLDFRESSDRIELDGGVYLGHHGRLAVMGGFYGVGSDRDGITLDPSNHDDLWYAGAFYSGNYYLPPRIAF